MDRLVELGRPRLDQRGENFKPLTPVEQRAYDWRMLDIAISRANRYGPVENARMADIIVRLRRGI